MAFKLKISLTKYLNIFTVILPSMEFKCLGSSGWSKIDKPNLQNGRFLVAFETVLEKAVVVTAGSSYSQSLCNICTTTYVCCVILLEGENCIYCTICFYQNPISYSCIFTNYVLWLFEKVQWRKFGSCFWVMVPYVSRLYCQSFEDPYCLHLQD